MCWGWLYGNVSDAMLYSNLKSSSAARTIATDHAALTHGNGREVEDMQMWLASSRLWLPWRGEQADLPRIYDMLWKVRDELYKRLGNELRFGFAKLIVQYRPSAILTFAGSFVDSSGEGSILRPPRYPGLGIGHE
ncbi:hypothetical protein KCU87_g137, partial [Aureobasidium melanogenum]